MDYAPELYRIPEASNQLTGDKHFNQMDTRQPNIVNFFKHATEANIVMNVNDSFKC